jgi:hypothetical protein
VDTNELARLLEAGDTHGLVVAAVRLHAATKFGDEWGGALVCVSLGVGREHEQIVIPRAARPSALAPSPLAAAGTAS